MNTNWMCAYVYVLACVPVLSYIHVWGQPIFRNIENYSNNLWMRIEFSYFCFMRIVRIVFKYLFHLRFLHQFTILISAWLRTTTFKPPRGMPISCNFVCYFFFRCSAELRWTMGNTKTIRSDSVTCACKRLEVWMYLWRKAKQSWAKVDT